MSGIISAIVGQPEPDVRKTINKLEHKNGYPSHDVRHLAENIQKTRVKLAELGLDPDDTTGEELYQALLARFNRDSQRFDKEFSLVGPSDDSSANLAARIVLNNFQMPERWALKSSAAKKLLKAQPPKKLMRRLGYRSVDSLIKRENLAEIYLGINYVESAGWRKSHAKLVSGSDSTAFELRQLQLSHLSTAKWGRVEGGDLLAYNNDYGVLGLLPNQENISTLSLVVLLLDGLASITELKVSLRTSKLSRALIWWSNTDGLVASLASEHISMSLSDASANSMYSHSFENRVSRSGRRGFWQDLLSRYENQLIPQEDLNISFHDLLSLKVPINQPAFEYAEDI